MQILLCAATSFEIQPTIDFIKKQNLSQKISVLITGIGLTATAYHLTKSICKNQPTLIVQAGIAGSFNAALALVQTVVVSSDAMSDLGVIENGIFKSVFNLGFGNENLLPWTGGKLLNPHTDLLKKTALPLATAVSVQQITTSQQQIAYYKTELGAQIESMEGAALHYVALMENTPFLQVRTISNFVGERNKQAWRLEEAIQELNVCLQPILLNFVA